MTTIVIMNDHRHASSSWSLATAKAQLTQVVDAAIAGTPQIITRHGEDAVIVISAKQYAESMARRSTLAEFFARSPLAGVDLELERNSSAARSPDL